MEFEANVGRPRLARRKVVYIPPISWLPARRNYLADSGPDPFKLDRELAALGIDTAIVDPYARPLNPFAEMTPLLQSLDPLRALRILISCRRADFIISVFEGAAASLLLLRRAMRFRPPIILWDIALTENWQLRERVLDFVVPRCDGMLVLNSSQAEYIQNRWRPEAAIEVIGHAVDTSFFYPMDFVDAGPILSVGDDVGRDFETLVAAMVGLPLQLEVKTSQKIQAKDNISVLGGRISYLELRALYARCLFVAVPLHETLNASGVSTILEAGAMGKALVVSESRSIADFIVPNETCLVVPQHDSSAMRQAIERLVGDVSLRRRLGENARSFVLNNCAEAAFAIRFARALERLRVRPQVQIW